MNSARPTWLRVRGGLPKPPPPVIDPETWQGPWRWPENVTCPRCKFPKPMRELDAAGRKKKYMCRHPACKRRLALLGEPVLVGGQDQ